MRGPPLEGRSPLTGAFVLTDQQEATEGRMAKIQEELLTTGELAELVGLKPRSLEEWRRFGRGPRFVRLPKGVRYPVSAVSRWLDEHMADTGGFPELRAGKGARWPSGGVA